MASRHTPPPAARRPPDASLDDTPLGTPPLDTPLAPSRPSRPPPLLEMGLRRMGALAVLVLVLVLRLGVARRSSAELPVELCTEVSALLLLELLAAPYTRLVEQRQVMLPPGLRAAPPPKNAPAANMPLHHAPVAETALRGRM